MIEELIVGLGAIVGDRHVVTGSDLHGIDPGFHPENLSGAAAVFPADTRQVADVVKICSKYGVSIVPQGGRTGLSGGAVSKAGSVALGLRRMNAVERCDPLAGTVVVQAGATLQSVADHCAVHGLSVGIDLGARGSATIGGMIATNAGGMTAFRNGTMRNRVLGTEIVLANGSIVTDLTEVEKCNEGYSLTQLICGSEGTLGIVTRAVLRLTTEPTVTSTTLIAVENAHAALTILRAVQKARDLTAVHAEIMWKDYAETVAAALRLSGIISFANAPAYFLLDVAETVEDGLLDLLSDLNVTKAIMCKSESERADLWRIREESFEIDRQVPHCEWFDISMPLVRIDMTLAGIRQRIASIDHGLRVWAMGHLGDGNLHLTIGSGQPLSDLTKTAIADAVYQGLKQIGGAFSAEHGIGIDKRASLIKHADPEKLRLCRVIKKAFDPENMLNPGKLI